MPADIAICQDCAHWTGKYYSRFAWCRKATEILRQLGVPAHDYVTVRCDADATKCPGATKKQTYTVSGGHE